MPASERKPRARRISITITDPLLAQLEAAARRAGCSIGDLLKIGGGQLLDAHERRIERANIPATKNATERGDETYAAGPKSGPWRAPRRVDVAKRRPRPAIVTSEF
ncbi:hypothetical protein BTH42_22430 [Burkholderia sp. SRS-W-2-2016]|nr:hypothetical protein BTH42_22430 [Burkholderia sp. SRS-W-2-2016]